MILGLFTIQMHIPAPKFSGSTLRLYPEEDSGPCSANGPTDGGEGLRRQFLASCLRTWIFEVLLDFGRNLICMWEIHSISNIDTMLSYIAIQFEFRTAHTHAIHIQSLKSWLLGTMSRLQDVVKLPCLPERYFHFTIRANK